MKAPRATPKQPECDCRAANVGGNHSTRCALAQHALKAGRLKDTRPSAQPPDGLGRKSRHQTATPTEARGMRFPSRIQAEVFEILMARREKTPGAAVICDPHFPLWKSWRPGMGKPLKFTPDFLLVTPRAVRALEPAVVGYDSVHAVEGTGWQEKDLDLFDVEVHEAKTRRGQESRDYVPRLAAFRAEHPTWSVFVWRWASKGQPPVCERLPDLAPAGGA